MQLPLKEDYDLLTDKVLILKAFVSCYFRCLKIFRFKTLLAVSSVVKRLDFRFFFKLDDDSFAVIPKILEELKEAEKAGGQGKTRGNLNK